MNKNRGAGRWADQDPVPIYYRLQMKLQEEIEDGRWALGERIPAERKIAESHGVSLGTAKKAILNLVNNGYLFRIKGTGTFVAGTTTRRNNLRHYRLLSDFGGAEAALKTRLISLRVREGDPSINRHLKIRADQDLYELRRVFTTQHKPIVYVISYLSRKRFKGLDGVSEERIERNPLFLLLEEEFGVTAMSTRSLLSATLADQETAEALTVGQGHPLLVCETLILAYKEQPYEYRISYFLTENRKLWREG